MGNLESASDEEIRQELFRRREGPWIALARATGYTPTLLNTCRQSKIWIDNTGQKWKVWRMTHEHQVNLLLWLERRMEVLKNTAELELSWPNDWGFEPPGEVVDELHEMSTEEFFEDLPLVKRLRKLTGIGANP